MSDLPKRLTYLPLSELAIPGSHNSCSYSIKSDCEITKDHDTYFLLKCMGDLGKSLSADWGRTQDVNLYEQLKAEIRCLDMRLLYRQWEDNFYFVHGQLGMGIETELAIISSFLTTHPKEVVILDFNHLYPGFNSDIVAKLVEKLEKFLGKMLVHRSRYIPSLHDLWNDGRQVIFIIHGFTELSSIWPKFRISSPWPDTASADELMKFIESHLPEKNRFHVTQGILTPSAAYLLFHAKGTLSDLAQLAGQKLLGWLKKNKVRIMIDFAGKMFPEFAQTVVNLNLTK